MPTLQPVLGDWWTVAGDPDLGELTDPRQEPVDFCVWQARDGRWQLWSCIRLTGCGGNTRLLHRWEGGALTDADWTPMGVAMEADESLGETPGGLQAPYVTRDGDRFLMFYGDWENVCLAESEDGKEFRRIVRGGRTGMFGEGPGANTRDPMTILVDGVWHCYYTAHPNREGSVYCRTSTDLVEWSDSKVVAFGGQAGTGPFSSECPFVVPHESGDYYLFRTQRYGIDGQTSVYRSDDPLDFGVEDDRFFVRTLPICAPEIVFHGGRYYIASLLPSLKGIRIATLDWE